MINAHDINRRRWDELTPVHARSEFYNVDGFLRGQLALDALERDGAGDVRGKSLLHLQCHFGLTTLSFARLGARVTGVDFSAASIAKAEALARQAGLSDSARFIGCDVLELERHLGEKFDVVFTSWGVITWLSDLKKWGRIIARFLKPDGHFFMAEVHPAALIFRENTANLEVAYDYFHDPAGVLIPASPDYADPSFTPSTAERYWAWSLADIFSALQDAGLRVSDFHEYPFSCFRQFPPMEKAPDGFWRFPKGTPSPPLSFSLIARHKM